MGHGLWSSSVYDHKTTLRAATGKSAFDYSDRVKSGATAAKIHESLDPHGVKLRESRDSDDHPTTLAITVLFDVTGSMHRIPEILQTKLKDLHGLILRKGYVEHPQIMFGGIGDATNDNFALQIGQWEADNRMDDDLGNIILEGGGGGGGTESYEIALYFMAKHTAMDCYEKRGEKGYLFIVGDEIPYPSVGNDIVRYGTGLSAVEYALNEAVPQPIPVEDIVAELQERFNVFYILPTQASHGHDPQTINRWKELLPERFIELDDEGAVCETIAMTIGIGQGSIDLDTGVSHLKELGVDNSAITAVAAAVSKLPVGAGSATVEGNLPSLTDDGGATRL